MDPKKKENVNIAIQRKKKIRTFYLVKIRTQSNKTPDEFKPSYVWCFDLEYPLYFLKFSVTRFLLTLGHWSSSSFPRSGLEPQTLVKVLHPGPETLYPQEPPERNHRPKPVNGLPLYDPRLIPCPYRC